METTLPKLSRIFIVLALLVAPTLASPWIVGRVHELQTLDELLVELDRPSHDLVLCVYKPRPQRERQLDSTLRRLASLLAGAAPRVRVARARAPALGLSDELARQLQVDGSPKDGYAVLLLKGRDDERSTPHRFRGAPKLTSLLVWLKKHSSVVPKASVPLYAQSACSKPPLG